MSEWIKRLAERYSEVNEKKLTGNQHKLDMDKDGDIDGDDFKQMRNKKKANEEEEVVMNPKKDKKGKESENMAAEAKLSEGVTRIDASEYHHDMADYHDAMHKHLVKKGTKEARAAAGHHKVAKMAHDDASYDHQFGERNAHRSSETSYRKSEAANNASRGVLRGKDGRLEKNHINPQIKFNDRKQYDESVEYIDEISKGLAQRYYSKSYDAQRKAMNTMIDTEKARKPEKKKAYDDARATFHKRGKGSDMAAKRLAYKGKNEEVEQESILPPVYSRIMEARATADKDGKHSKKAAPPEDWNEKEKNNKGAMDMKKDMAVDASGKVSNYDDLGHDDASKAGRATNAAKTRPGDNAAGDKKIVNPVKGATS